MLIKMRKFLLGWRVGSFGQVFKWVCSYIIATRYFSSGDFSWISFVAMFCVLHICLNGLEKTGLGDKYKDKEYKYF